jgi:hypothetical protein
LGFPKAEGLLVLEFLTVCSFALGQAAGFAHGISHCPRKDLPFFRGSNSLIGACRLCGGSLDHMIRDVHLDVGWAHLIMLRERFEVTTL